MWTRNFDACESNSAVHLPTCDAMGDAEETFFASGLQIQFRTVVSVPRDANLTWQRQLSAPQTFATPNQIRYGRAQERASPPCPRRLIQTSVRQVGRATASGRALQAGRPELSQRAYGSSLQPSAKPTSRPCPSLLCPHLDCINTCLKAHT